jgi:trans-AT polyketide synthase/acyltransferase/oxidoreductase domain-containing protein
MGRELLNGDATFRKWLTELDRIASGEIGESVLDRVYDDRLNKGDVFADLRFTHPAIFMLQVAQAKTLNAHDIKADYLLGASLGEFTAAALADVISLDTAIKLLVRQAEVFERTCSGTGMLVVHASPCLFHELAFLDGEVDLAGMDCHDQFTVAGPNEAIDRAVAQLQAKNILCQKVPVPAAFHSRWIDQAAGACSALMAGIELRDPNIPIISCTDAGVRTRYEPEDFWRATRQPVEFAKTIQMVENRGRHLYLDLGPSGALANLAKRNIAKSSASQVFPLLTPFGRDLELQADVKSFHRGNRNVGETRNLKVYGFPGQGSQARSMGTGLFDEFKDLVARADTILGYSVKALALEDAERKLAKTEFTQPALYVVGALSYLRKKQQDPTRPDYLLGHSLGEYVALFAADVFDFEVGLQLVQQRGKLMATIPGGMAAIIDCELEKLEGILKDRGLEGVEVANYNAPCQFIVAGPKEDLARLEQFLRDGKMRCAPLNVSAPFHSSYMRGVAAEFRLFLEPFVFAAPRIPVIANVDARPYRVDRIKETLVRQIAEPVRWRDSIDYLLDQGAIDFEELGSGKVLTKLVESIRAQRRSASITAAVASRSGPRELNGQPISFQVAKNHVAPDRIDRCEAKAKMHTAGRIESAIDMSGAGLRAGDLGAQTFRSRYGLNYAYVAGSMCAGISGPELIVRLSRAGLIGMLGSRGLELPQLERDIRAVQDELGRDGRLGVNLTHEASRPERAVALVRLLRRLGVRQIEASGFLAITSALVEHRLKGARRDAAGLLVPGGRILAKVARREVAEALLQPAPERLVRNLVQQGILTAEEAELSGGLPMADDLCVEGETGWQHMTNNFVSVLPHILRLRDAIARSSNCERIHVGAAGGIGSPQAAAAAFVMGADFILTGSINQCTVEARTSEPVKDMLEQAGPQDTDYAPFGEISELAARIQVLKKGVFFPARARRLQELWRHFDALTDIDAKTRLEIESKYLRQSFDEAYEKLSSQADPQERAKAQADPKYKMACVFSRYLNSSLAAALAGESQQRIDFQIPCGPALGDFNQWVGGTSFARWRERHVDAIAIHLMEETAALLRRQFGDHEGGQATARDPTFTGAAVARQQ